MGGLCLKTFFDEESVPNREEKENSKICISSIQCIVDKTFKPTLYEFDLDNT